VRAVTGSEEQARANLGMAKCYLDFWDYPKAFPFLRVLTNNRVNKTIKGDIYIAISRAYSTEMKADSALIYLDLAYETWKKFPDAEREINWRNEKARSFKMLMQFKESVNILEEGKNVLLSNQFSISANTTARFWGNLADSYQYFGWPIKNRDAVEKFNDAMNNIPFRTIAWCKIALNWGLYFNSFPMEYYIEEKGLSQLNNTSQVSRIDSINTTIEAIFKTKFTENSLQIAFMRMLTNRYPLENVESGGKNIYIIEDYFGANSIINALKLIQNTKFYNASQKTNLLKDANKILETHKNSNISLFLNNLHMLAWEYSNMNICDSVILYHNQILSICADNHLEIEYARYLNIELSSTCFWYKYNVGKPKSKGLEKVEQLLDKNLGDSSLLYLQFGIFEKEFEYYSIPSNDTSKTKLDALLAISKLEKCLMKTNAYKKGSIEHCQVKVGIANYLISSMPNWYSEEDKNERIKTSIVVLEDLEGIVLNSNILDEAQKKMWLTKHVYQNMGKAYEFMGDFKNYTKFTQLAKQLEDSKSKQDLHWASMKYLHDSRR
jgi:hypothetical protein